MADFVDADLRGSRFEDVDLTGARFARVDLTGVELQSVDLADATLRDVDIHQVVMRNVGFLDVDITGEIRNLTINGVEVGQYVEDELDRRYPERSAMRPTDADGFREAWEVVERLWAGTVERARGFDPAALHESVDGEWSFIETLRHLAFATDCWLRRAILGDPAPWHPLDLPWDGMPDTPGVPRDRAVRPSLDEALALRRDRMDGVRHYLEALTDEALASTTEPVEGPGWPPAHRFPVRECLLTILNEEWEHRLYAERDLTALEARG